MIMNSENIIYALVDKVTQEIRYIGKSVSGLDRPKEHFKPCNLKGNSYKQNWINKCLTEGNKPEIIILESFENPNDLFEAEIFWIAYYKGLGAKLTNLTNGGEGCLGRFVSVETRQKIGEKQSIFRKGKPLPEGMFVEKKNIIINGEEYKKCSKCNLEKQIKEFSERGNCKTKQTYCKSCNLVINQEWRKENPLPTLSQEEYNKTRMCGAIAGGETSKTPERRKQASEQRSKPIRGIHIETGEIIKFDSALKAKEAGFQNSNIGVAIKKGKPYKNYIWLFD